jgi:hypothetical protein
MKRTLIAILVLFVVALFTTIAEAQSLVLKWANTSITLGSGNNGLGYSPVSGNVIASVCASSTAGNATIYQLKFSDGTSAGANLSVPAGTITGGTYVIGGLDVGSDGVIYACAYGATMARIYTWANESATPTVLCNLTGVGVGSIGKNLRVYGTGNNAVFLLTSTTTGPVYVYYNGSAWAAKTLTVSSGSCQSDMTFISWSSSSCVFASKNSSANGYRGTFNPSSASPIAVTQDYISPWNTTAPTIHNVAYDPVTGLYGTHYRDINVSPWTHTINTWTTGGPGTGGTTIAPTAQTAVTRNSSATDAGAIGACCWGNRVFFDMAAVGGFGLVAYDVKVYRITDTTPAGPLQVSPGGSQSFSVVSGGSGTLTYQWKVNKGSGYANVSGSEYSGATTATLTINPTATGDSGTYECVVNGVSSSTWTSTGASLTVYNPCTPPSVGAITPASQTVCAGAPAVFSVPAPTGTGPFHYQWQKVGGGTVGTDSSSYAIASVAAGDAGSYQCVVSGACTPNATATAGALAVNAPPIAPNSSTTDTANHTLVFYADKLLAKATPGGNSSLSVLAAGPTSAQGPANNVVLDTGAGSITYTPKADYVGSDSFSYTISDGNGCTVSPTITVNIVSSGGSSPNVVSSCIRPNGHFQAWYAGIPGVTYSVQWATSLDGPWTACSGSYTAGENGLFEFEDTTEPPPSSCYYRTVCP